jgi:hyperosmotically inducible protein
MIVLQVIAAVLAALLLVAAAAVSGPAAAQGAPSLADASITARIERALYNELTLAHADISVDTRNGIVTLSGFASAMEDIAMAGRLAGGIDGVRVVTNAIRVANRRSRA